MSGQPRARPKVPGRDGFPVLLSDEMNDFKISPFLLQVLSDKVAAMIGYLLAAHSICSPY